MHILTLPSWYVTPERPDCGIYFREMALFFHRAGHTSGVIYADTNIQFVADKIKNGRFFSTVQHTDHGLPTVRYDGFGWPRRTAWGQDAYARTVMRLFDRYCATNGRPTIIHAHSYPAAFAAARIKEKTGIPYVYSEVMTHLKDGQFPTSHRRMIQKAIEQADLVSAVSSATAGWVQAVQPTPIEIVPLTVDTNRFQLRALRPPDAPFTFVNVGDLIERRAPEVAIEAFALLKKRLPDVPLHLDMIGDGPLRAALGAQCRQLGISESVQFHGLLGNDAVANWLSTNADALLLTSRLETFGVVLIEAMSCGLPVVSTNSGGPADIVTPETGFLVGVDDIAAIAAAMQRMVLENSRFDVERIRQYAVDKFGHAAVTQRWLHIFEQILRTK